ncbi:unnamed protein product, partial [marine sediment metagenome]
EKSKVKDRVYDDGASGGDSDYCFFSRFTPSGSF